MLKDLIDKKGLVSGVIASLLVLIFIQPILQFIWVLFLNASNLFYRGFMDSIYENAARGHKNNIDFRFFYIFVLLIVETYIFLLWRIIKKSKEKATEIKENKKKISIITDVVIPLCFLGIFFLSLFSDYADLELNTSFSQRATIIAPYLSEQEEKELKAMWAYMKNRAGYENINKKLDYYAQKNNIKLPKSLLK